MFVIGLTGGIASGKSLVSRILGDLGAEIIDADTVGHQVIEPGLPAYEEILEYFGLRILDSQDRIDRKVLGQIVFSNPEKLQVLNRISHPRIFEEICRILEDFREQGAPEVVVIEAALLFDIKLDTLVDEVWTVETDPSIQVRRLMERNKLTEEKAWERIRAQAPAQVRIAKADKVIRNLGEEENLARQILAMHKSILSGIPCVKSTYHSDSE